MAAAAAIVVIGGVRIVRVRAAARDAAVVAAALGQFNQVRWRSPTDALLETPGYQVLVTVPPVAMPGGLP